MHKEMWNIFLWHTQLICVSPSGADLPIRQAIALGPQKPMAPKTLFIYQMRIKRGHANVYYHDNRLRVRVERASCFPARAPLSLSLSLSASALFSARTQIFTLAAERSCALS